MVKCYMCNKGNLVNKKVPYELYGQKLGDFEAEVCTECREVFFSEETSKKITALAKKEGLWGLSSKTKIGQAGTALDIRLSKKLIDFFRLKRGEEVILYPESRNRLVAEFPD